MRYRTNNEGTGYRGRDHDQPTKPEAEHLEHCPVCRQDFDKRNLGQVLHHAEPEHQPLSIVN
jgi:hypothetical protein